MVPDPIYDSISELVCAVKENDLNPENIKITVDNDYSEAFIDDPDNFKDSYPESIVDDESVDMQILARDENLPRSTLEEILEVFDFNVSPP